VQFRQSCTKNYLDDITKQDLADLVVFMKVAICPTGPSPTGSSKSATLLCDPDETRGKGKGIKDVTLGIK
jgi:hypothetical protein